jgi:hypothetical protein
VWPPGIITYNFIFDGCESISPPMTITPFSFTLPVNLKKSKDIKSIDHKCNSFWNLLTSLDFKESAKPYSMLKMSSESNSMGLYLLGTKD